MNKIFMISTGVVLLGAAIYVALQPSQRTDIQCFLPIGTVTKDDAKLDTNRSGMVGIIGSTNTLYIGVNSCIIIVHE